MKNPLFASFFFTKNKKDSRYGRANSTCSDGVRACVSSIEKAKVGRRKRDRYLISRIRSSNSPATAKSAPKSFDPPFHFARATTDGALQFCNYVSTSLQRERDSLCGSVIKAETKGTRSVSGRPSGPECGCHQSTRASFLFSTGISRANFPKSAIASFSILYTQCLQFSDDFVLLKWPSI